MDLFASRTPPHTPLAERMRPASLDEVVGHEELLRPGGFLHGLLRRGEMIQSIMRELNRERLSL